MTSLIKSEDERDANNKRWRYENLQHNQWRRMKLHTDLQSQQQNHRLKAAWLQGRWLEVSEQERRSQLHNQKLLQDFQRAQDTLDDMVARTEAMNTIRVQYERYLEENFPRWQQKLKDMRVSEKSKISKEDILKNAGNRATLPPLISIRVQKHLKNCVHQMEEDQGINSKYRSDTTAHPLSSIFPDHTQLPTSLLYTHHVDKDTRQNAARCNQNDQAYLPPTWLTGSQPFISGFPQNNIPKDYKNFHNIQALSHNLPPYSLPCDSHHQSHSPVQHKSSTINHMYQNPWAGIGQGIGIIPTGHFTPTGASWPQLPVLNPMAWGMMDVPDPHVERTQCSETEQENTTQEMLRPSKESNLRLKHKSKGRECEYLDCRPDHEESSALSSEVSGMKKKIKKRRHRTVSQSKANGRKYQSSSTLSQDSCGQADPQKSKKHQKPSTTAEQENSKKTTNNDTYAVKQDEEDDEQEESRSQKTTPSHAGSDKTDGLEVNQKNSAEKEDTDKNSHEIIADEKISDRKGVDESDEEMVAGTDDEEDAGLDDREGNREETEYSDGEKKDAEEDIPDSDSEEGEDKPEREIEKNCSHNELVKEARGAQGGTLKSARKNETESDEEESDDNIDISERNIQITNNSLKEVYGHDETEEEEIVNNQDIYDDDDEIVVEQSFPWTKDSLYDQTKCNDDNNEDIEDLLNPHVSSQTHQGEDVEDTDQPNDLHSDSDVEDLPKKSAPAATNKPAESDDEFDHFYD